jgi:hypothetical protein
LKAAGKPTEDAGGDGGFVIRETQPKKKAKKVMKKGFLSGKGTAGKLYGEGGSEKMMCYGQGSASYWG